jgi:hypothetical protein
MALVIHIPRLRSKNWAEAAAARPPLTLCRVVRLKMIVSMLIGLQNSGAAVATKVCSKVLCGGELCAHMYKQSVTVNQTDSQITILCFKPHSHKVDCNVLLLWCIHLGVVHRGLRGCLPVVEHHQVSTPPHTRCGKTTGHNSYF